MRLIIGGAYQGKLEFTIEKYQVETVADGNTCTIEDTFSCEVLNHFEILIKRFFSTIEETISYLDTLIIKNPNVIIVSTEVGNGVVPIDSFSRDYRELVGRVCCEVSKRAETVERVFCGLGVFLKC
ncbi:MAG: bifunctional adenosylcobinamide kinase/adenosylcobinamide-phosphate guanylyltransferase [Oscillospiraceae bacterium]